MVERNYLLEHCQIKERKFAKLASSLGFDPHHHDELLVIRCLAAEKKALEKDVERLKEEVKELLFKRHGKRTKAEERRFRELLGMSNG